MVVVIMVVVIMVVVIMIVVIMVVVIMVVVIMVVVVMPTCCAGNGEAEVDDEDNKRRTQAMQIDARAVTTLLA
jgi:hypothetical protein